MYIYIYTYTYTYTHTRIYDLQCCAVGNARTARSSGDAGKASLRTRSRKKPLVSLGQGIQTIKTLACVPISTAGYNVLRAPKMKSTPLALIIGLALRHPFF